VAVNMDQKKRGKGEKGKGKRPAPAAFFPFRLSLFPQSARTA
jgi:hypothetical protein